MNEHQDSSPELLQQAFAHIHEASARVNPDAGQTWNWSLRVLLSTQQFLKLKNPMFSLAILLSTQQFSSVSHRELLILGRMFL